MSRCDIHFVNLDPALGREQAGRRPVLIVSSDTINRLPLVVTVVTGTDARNVSSDYASNVRVRAAESGLPMDTVFYCFQVRSLDPSRFRDAPAGRLQPAKMAEVDAALRRVLGLSTAPRV